MTEIADEKALREKARDAIRSARLPVRRAERVWGGPGRGNTCAVCLGPVTPDGLGFDLEFSPNGATIPGTCHVHIRCFAAWSAECDCLLQGDGKAGTITPRERETKYKREPGS